ncbi:MAG: hypothetical protein L6V93_08355 [Clostridiales bacterium]|nr:MAG: hypothetical protein L6V93_08355 [Clostridiales bacterium]
MLTTRTRLGSLDRRRDFYYTVIPDASVDGVDDEGNGEKQYFVVSNTYYGKIPGYASLTERESWIFDPEIDGGYAHWLNNKFLNGVSAEKHDNCDGNSLDDGIVNYLRAHDWYVEGYGPSTPGEENIDEKYHYDYYANAKSCTPFNCRIYEIRQIYENRALSL